MFSLDHEAVDYDAHYDFKDEARVRRSLYKPGDEKQKLHTILIRYIRENGGRLILSSDAHRKEAIAWQFEELSEKLKM